MINISDVDHARGLLGVSAMAATGVKTDHRRPERGFVVRQVVNYSQRKLMRCR